MNILILSEVGQLLLLLLSGTNFALDRAITRLNHPIAQSLRLLRIFQNFLNNYLCFVCLEKISLKALKIRIEVL